MSSCFDYEELLTEKERLQFKVRRDILKRIIKSYTIYGMTDPPLKSEEEIDRMKDYWQKELTIINEILEKDTNQKKFMLEMGEIFPKEYQLTEPL